MGVIRSAPKNFFLKYLKNNNEILYTSGTKMFEMTRPFLSYQTKGAGPLNWGQKESKVF